MRTVTGSGKQQQGQSGRGLACSGGRRVRLTGLSLAAIGALGLTGCNNPLKDENAALKQENAELRSQLEQKDAALGDLEGRLAAADSEARRLAQEAAARPAQPAAAGGAGPGATGFEGINDVNIQRGRSQISVGVAGDVLFDSGQTTLKSTARRTLDQVASVIQSRYASNRIRIEGHSDSDPIRRSKWGTNERLSAERALAVEEYLSSKGIAKSRMYVAGFGPDEPKGSKRESRRVEIVILE